MIRLLIAATFMFGGGYFVVVGVGEGSVSLTLAGLVAFASGAVLVLMGERE